MECFIRSTTCVGIGSGSFSVTLTKENLRKGSHNSQEIRKGTIPPVCTKQSFLVGESGFHPPHPPLSSPTTQLPFFFPPPPAGMQLSFGWWGEKGRYIERGKTKKKKKSGRTEANKNMVAFLRLRCGKYKVCLGSPVMPRSTQKCPPSSPNKQVS